MSEQPETIWAITEPNDESAQILGDVYAQQLPDGMNGAPTEYIRRDIHEKRMQAVIAEREEIKRDTLSGMIGRNI